MANWADLPYDLFLRISDFYITPDFIVRMQSTCKSWRSILKGSIHHGLPWLMMVPNKEEEEEDPDARIFFSLSNQKTHTIPIPEMRGKRCFGSFQNGWLMTVDDKLDVLVFHPWSKKKFNFPHHSTFKDRNHEGCTTELNIDLHIHKAALSDDAKVAVVVYGDRRLAFCRTGDDAYTRIEIGFETLMDDVIYHKGKFYALSMTTAIFLLHIEEGRYPSLEILTVKLDPVSTTSLGYLVPDILTDSMFVVIRDTKCIQHTNKESLPRQTLHNFDVYWVPLAKRSPDIPLKQFTKVESLGDRVVFLGINSSIIVMASQFPGFKGNRIYFADSDSDGYYESPCGCHDLGVYSLEDGNVEQFFDDRFHPPLSPPIWIASCNPSLFILDRFWLGRII